MVVFVPRGDESLVDPTRTPEFYDGVAEYLLECGAVPIERESARE